MEEWRNQYAYLRVSSAYVRWERCWNTIKGQITSQQASSHCCFGISSLPPCKTGYRRIRIWTPLTQLTQWITTILRTICSVIGIFISNVPRKLMRIIKAKTSGRMVKMEITRKKRPIPNVNVGEVNAVTRAKAREIPIMGVGATAQLRATKITATNGRGATLIQKEGSVDLILKQRRNSTRRKQRGQTFGTGTSMKSGKMRRVAAPKIIKGAAADADMEADVVAAVVDITADVAADVEDMADVATKVAAGADTMVVVRTTIKATSRTRIKAINKVEDTTTMRKDTIKIIKLLQLDHLKINLGSPTTTWGLQGQDHHLLKRHPVNKSVCASQGGIIVLGIIRETTSLRAPTIQLLAKTSS